MKAKTMPPVTEIRVHGVGGASAAQLLDDPDPVQVAGDRVSGFWRSRHPSASHTKEAYVWGGLTSKALLTGFWWLLLPFTLANVSGWMMRPGANGEAASGLPVGVYVTIEGRL